LSVVPSKPCLTCGRRGPRRYCPRHAEQTIKWQGRGPAAARFRREILARERIGPIRSCAGQHECFHANATLGGTMSEDSKAAARAVFTVWSTGAIDRLDDLVDRDVVHHDPYDPTRRRALTG
jgi:hypothetical protein